MPPLPAHGPPPRPCLEAAPLRRREDPGAPTFAERRGVREPTGLPSGLSSTQRGEGGARRHVSATELLMLFGENKHLALPNAWLHLWRQGQAGDQGSKSDRSPAPSARGRPGPEAERVTGWGPAARQGQGAGPLGERPRGAPTPHWPLAARSGRGRGPRAQGAGGGRAAAELGLISAGSWRPVRARAPRPNSMAIVRRPLCSGGGHFLRGLAGASGRKRPEPSRGPDAGRPSLGSEATAAPLERPGLGAGSPSRAGSQAGPSSAFLRVSVCRPQSGRMDRHPTRGGGHRGGSSRAGRGQEGGGRSSGRGELLPACPLPRSPVCLSGQPQVPRTGNPAPQDCPTG